MYLSNYSTPFHNSFFKVSSTLMIFYLLNTLEIFYTFVFYFVVWAEVKLLVPSLAVCKASVHQYPGDKARPAYAL